MYCRNCGKQIADDSKFCYSCGETVREMKAPNVRVAGKGDKSAELSPKTKRSSSPEVPITRKRKKPKFGKLLKYTMLILLSVPIIILTVFLIIAIVKGRMV